jgi:hypothetical protein
VLQQWWSSYWHIGDDERPSNFETGGIRKLVVKKHKTKTKRVRNNSSKKAIKEGIQ